MTTLFFVSLGFALVALLLRLRNHWQDSKERGLVAAWEPCMLDVLAGDAPDDALLTLVDSADASFFLTFLLGYARRLQGAERLTVVRLAHHFLPALAARAQRGGPEKRAHAVQVLAALGLPQHADTVAAGLDDRSPYVAMIAARGLFRRGYEQYHAVVLRHLPRFTLWSRSFLSSMLARGGPGTAPFLRETFADEEAEPMVRAIVADALRLLNDIEATSIAALVLADPQRRDRELVTACVRLLRRLGHEEHIQLLRPLAASADPLIRASAVGALGAIGGPAEIPLLQDVLDDVAYWVSLEAARGLMSLGAVTRLQQLADSRGPWSVLARQVLAE